MEGISNLGIEVILYLQVLGEWLIGPMKFFTFLGNEEFYLFVAPALFPRLAINFGELSGDFITQGIISTCLTPFWSPNSSFLPLGQNGSLAHA